MIPLLILIFIFGLLFWSLSSVLVDRWHSGKWGILLGRSECPKCRHLLWASELIPLFSYIIQWWKCKHCSTNIPIFYPLAELLMASVFMILSYTYIRNWGILFSSSHILILATGFVTWVYILYDLRYMEIPDQIIVPAIYIYLLLLIGSIFYSPLEVIFFDRITYTGNIEDFVWDHLMAAWILYTFFYIQIILPGGWHLLRRGKMRDFLELLASYAIFPITLLFSFHKKREESDSEEIPTWIGGGDLRIALFIWLTLGTLHGISSFAFAYILGSIFGIVFLLFKWRSHLLHNQIPFGPFLGIGWIIAIFYHEIILDSIVRTLSFY